MGCHFLLQGIFLTQGSNLPLLHCLAGRFFTTELPGKSLGYSCLTAATAITAVRHVIETVTVLYKWILEALKIQSLWTRGKFMWTTSSCLPVSAIRVQFWIHSTGSWLISWYWMLYSCLSATWCEELTHQKSPWCWERLKVAAEGHDRGWNGWMASLTRWAWIWASSRSWWWTGKPGVL